MGYYDSYNRGGFSSSLPVVTKNLLIINVLMLILTSLNRQFMISTFALYYPTSPMFHWWQPLTHMFMHGGFWHLFCNMFTLLMFGCSLERQWGPRKYLIFYFVTGLGAAVLHTGVMWLQMHHYMNLIADGGSTAAAAMARINAIRMVPTVGASGAIYGVLIGFAMLYPDTKMTLIFPPVTLSAKWWVIIWMCIELVTGFTGVGGGIAHFAHLGGMLFGFLLIKWWKRKGTMYQYEQ